jgi:hypothetical protein
MEFKLARTEYDWKTKRAYIELGTCDADGGDAIATAIFSFATIANCRKKRWKKILCARHAIS